MNRLFIFLAHTVVLLVLALAGVWVWAEFIEEPFLSYENAPFPLLAKQIRPGEPLGMIVVRCNSASETRFYDVERSLVNVSNPAAPPIILPSARLSLRPGCEQSESKFNTVPIGTPPGTYVLAGAGFVRGMLRTFIVPLRSQPFEVTQ